MQDVVVLDLLVRIEMEPALAALLLGAVIPGDRQGLQPAVRKFDEILLQRLDAEGVFHLERGELAVGVVGLDEEFPGLAEEAGVHAVMVKARVAEIAEHRLVGRMLHGELVLRCAPQLRFRPVTAGAALAADEGGCRNGGGAGVCIGQQLKCQAARDDDRRRGRRRDDDRPPRTAPRRRVALSGAPPIDIPCRSGRSLRSVFFPGTLFGASHAVTARALDRSLQIVHSLGSGEGPCAAGAIAARIETLGACQRRIERGLCARIGPLHRAGRRLVTELCGDQLRRHRPRVRVVGGLPHRLFELRDLVGTRAGMRRCDAKTQGEAGDPGCGHSSPHEGTPALARDRHRMTLKCRRE
jgi:hypothetical protein